jgi:hypothetical protein
MYILTCTNILFLVLKVLSIYIFIILREIFHLIRLNEMHYKHNNNKVFSLLKCLLIIKFDPINNIN